MAGGLTASLSPLGRSPAGQSFFGRSPIAQSPLEQGPSAYVLVADTSQQGGGADHSTARKMDTREFFVERQASREVAAKRGFGTKTIGLFGGVMLLTNSLAGPTISLMPALVQEAGWLPTTLLMVTLALASAACGHMLLAAMRAMPNNEEFDLRVEFTDLLRFYMPCWLHALTMFCYFFYLILTLMTYIIQTAQVLDYVSLNLIGCGYGLELFPAVRMVCGKNADSSTPFGDSTVLSASFLLVVIVCAPFAWLNLDDNVVMQGIAILGLTILSVVWAVLLVEQPEFPQPVPVATPALGNLLGTLLFNFACMGSLPSWANERKPGVSVNLSFALSMGYVALVYLSIGIIGGMAYAPYFQTDANLFSKFNASNSWLAKLSVAVYPILQNLTSIPVFAIFIRYNLLQLGWLQSGPATAVAFLLPWALSIPFYTGSGFQRISDVGGLVFSSAINFVVPVLLYVLSRCKAPSAPPVCGDCSESESEAPSQTRSEGTP